jgi:hypothetical protein
VKRLKKYFSDFHIATLIISDESSTRVKEIKNFFAEIRAIEVGLDHIAGIELGFSLMKNGTEIQVKPHSYLLDSR